MMATFFNNGWEECYRGLKAVTAATNFENRKELPVTKLNTDCYGGALFQLTSGELLWRTPDDLGNSTYYVLYPDEKQCQPFKLPPLDCTSCDIAWLVAQVQTTAVRYLTPIEDIVVVLEGKDLDGVESSKLLAGVFLVVDIVPGGKIFRPVKKLGQAGLKGTKKLLVTIGKTSKAYIGEVVDGVYKPFKWIKPDKVDEIIEVTEEVTYLAEDGVQRVGKLEVVRSGAEYGVRVVLGTASDLITFASKTLSQKLDDIANIWKTRYPIEEMFEGRVFFENIMGYYRYLKSSGWKHTADIAENFKAIDFYKGTAQGNQIFAETAVSMKTTITTNVDNWLASEPIKKNIEFLEQGWKNVNGLESNGMRMFFNNAEIHIYMPKENITDALKTTWMNKLNAVNSKIQFEIKALEDFIQ